MAKRKKLFFLTLAVALALFMFLRQSDKMEKSVKILFPLSLLNPKPELINPQNTETIWEYYLLENLSCGLVRDSQNSPMGYEGCIAERFYQESPRLWVFILKNMSWSDGSVVTNSQISNWINSLVDKNSRHVQFLKHAQNVSYDGNNRTLKIEFPFDTDKTILHELSLADAGLFPDDYKLNGWSKTVGPYFVEKWDFKQNILKLAKNKFSPLFSNESPSSAELFRLIDPSQRREVFKTIEVDILPLTATSNPKSFEEILPNASHVFEGFPTAISYFVLNHNCVDTHISENRNIFAEAINNLKSSIEEATKEMPGLKPENQMIPNGFDGRIDKFTAKSVNSSTKLKKIVLALPTIFKEMNLFGAAINGEFLKKNIELSIEYTDQAVDDAKYFARLTSFLGNQLDATGSWAFLASPESGVLKNWYSLYASEYQNVYSLKEISKKDNNLKLLHEKVLNTKIIVPLMVGSQRYLLSNRVNVDSWNKFDSRLRIYLIKWQ